MELSLNGPSVAAATQRLGDALTNPATVDLLLDDMAESIRIAQAGTLNNVFSLNAASPDDVVASFADLERSRVVAVRGEHVPRVLRDIARGRRIGQHLPYLVMSLPSSGFGRNWFDTPEILGLLRNEIGNEEDVLVVDPLRSNRRTQHLQPGLYWRIPRENGERRFDVRLRRRFRAGGFGGGREPVDLVGFAYFYFTSFADYDWSEVSLAALRDSIPATVARVRAAIAREVV